MKYQALFYLLSLFGLLQCGIRENATSAVSNEFDALALLKNDDVEQVGQYIVELFEDSKGNIWIGTLQHGVAKYDGKSLVFYSDVDGLAGNGVVDIEEDKDGVLWMGTQDGLSRYDGKVFESYKREDADLNRISNMVIDRKGLLWVGTWSGVSTFENGEFTTFDLPKPDVEIFNYQTTLDWVTELMEDYDGNIWIGRDGYGACVFNGKDFDCIIEKEGLPSNNVMEIVKVKNGDLWIGTRMVERDKPGIEEIGKSGLVRIRNGIVEEYKDIPGFYQAEIYAIYETIEGEILIGTRNNGLYIHGARGFRNYTFKDLEKDKGMPIQSLLKDSKGRIWIGCSGGLFRLEGEEIINIPRGELRRGN